MTERQILFKGDMVRAILSGAKTQTRRPVVLRECGKVLDVGCHRDIDAWWRRPDGLWDAGHSSDGYWATQATGVQCPYGQPGDTLWVRERWRDSTARPATTRYAGAVVRESVGVGCQFREAIMSDEFGKLPRLAAKLERAAEILREETGRYAHLFGEDSLHVQRQRLAIAAVALVAHSLREAAQ